MGAPNDEDFSEHSERQLLMKLVRTSKRTEEKVDLLMIGEATFDSDLAVLVGTTIPAVTDAYDAALVARDAEITSLQAQLAAAGTPPAPPDFSAEDTTVNTANTTLQAKLAAIPPAAITPPAGTGTPAS